jgi:hypothetical protein
LALTHAGYYATKAGEFRLFTEVLRIGILRTSPFGDSAKFAYTEFSEVRRSGVLGNTWPPSASRLK